MKSLNQYYVKLIIVLIGSFLLFTSCRPSLGQYPKTVETEVEEAIYTSIYEYEHTGLLPGYQSIARYHPDMDAVVVQFVRTSGKNSWYKSERIFSRIVNTLEKEN